LTPGQPYAYGTRMATTSTRGLTLDSVVEAALELTRDEGFPALSMRKLANRCGVGAMTLYGYVRTKDELLAMIADKLLATVELPATRDMPWMDAVKMVFRSVRRIFLEHPELADVVAGQHLNSVAAYRGAEVVLDAVRRAGLNDEEAVSAFVALTAFAVGVAQREAHGKERSAQQAQRLMAIHRLPVDEFRNVVELGPLMVVGESERHFEDGLDLMIRGIAARGAGA
jgi:AcrR family transcriptional regulator